MNALFSRIAGSLALSTLLLCLSDTVVGQRIQTPDGYITRLSDGWYHSSNREVRTFTPYSKELIEEAWWARGRTMKEVAENQRIGPPDRVTHRNSQTLRGTDRITMWYYPRTGARIQFSGQNNRVIAVWLDGLNKPVDSYYWVDRLPTR